MKRTRYPKFSAIIVNYASWPLTLRCVEALYEAGGEIVEVIVVDNDDTEPPKLPPGTCLIRNPRNTGFAQACNRGAAAANGELVILINPDTVVDEGFFEPLEEFFRSNPEAGIAGPKVLDGDGKVQLSAREEIGLLSGIMGRTSLLTRLFPESSLVRRQFPALGEVTVPIDVDWVSGACMVSRRQTLEALCGLDERFFMYFEDADLCRRARVSGWLVYYLPGVTVTHEAGGSTVDKPRAIWRLHRSAFLYHRKHDRHGPLQLYSLLVLAGLILRALTKLAVSLADKLPQKTGAAKRETRSG